MPAVLASGVLLFGGGCLGLRPAHNPVRHFVLEPAAGTSPAAIPAGAPALGIGQVRIPAHLYSTSIAIRRGVNEIERLPLALWGERLDLGLQRVLAANLAAMVPTDNLRLSAWRADDVAMEVHVSFERFDFDAEGRAELVAWWRLRAPGGERELDHGRTRLTAAGPSPVTDPAGAVATLNGLVADFSRQLAQAVNASSARE